MVLIALRYVVLRHEGVPQPHFDLMFETSPGSALLTWRSAVWPLEHQTELVRLADHRADYLTYEGPVSNDRGFVTRVTSGHHEITFKGALLTIVHLKSPVDQEWLIGGSPHKQIAVLVAPTKTEN